MKLADLFCGCWGWSQAFAERGWECWGYDLLEKPAPKNCYFVRRDILTITAEDLRAFDFIVASSPCEQFSVHGMKHFHPSPPYPTLGIQLFNHTRAICEESGVPYVMENVRSAQQFVGRAVHHCGPFYLWGNAVPILMPQGVRKGISFGDTKALKLMSNEQKRAYRKQFPWLQVRGDAEARSVYTAQWATIPPILANAVVDHAEILCQLARVSETESINRTI